MAIRNHWTTSSLACIVTENFAPLAAVSTVSTAFTVDVTPSSSGTINSVTFNWGDASNDPGVLGVAPEYGASHTYASAGDYLVKVVTDLTTGELDETWFIVTVS